MSTSEPIPILIRWISRRALRWCYREIRFVGTQQIPAKGPVLLFGNHPNDLPDVLAGFFTTTRQVRYVATISATVLPLAATTYRGLGVIPVTRIRDVRKMKALGVDVSTVNRSAYNAVVEAFGAGDLVGVFPEGGVIDSSRVGTMHAGVGKMALRSLDTDGVNDVKLVAFGMQYEAPRTLRSDVIVQVGAPFSLARWAREAEEPTPVALSKRLHEELVAVTRNSHSWALADARDRLTAVIAAVMATASEPLLETAVRVQPRCARLVDGSDRSHPSPDSAAEWTALADGVARIVERVGGLPTSARDIARVLDAAAGGLEEESPQAHWPPMAFVVGAAVPAAIGLALHAPLFALVQWVARRLAADRSELVAKAILPGLHLIFLGYLILGGFFALGFRAVAMSAWWAIPFVMLLPRLGDLGLAWRDALRALQLRTRVRRLSASDAASIRSAAEQVRRAWMALSTSPYV